MVHVVGGEFVYIAKGVLQGVFAYPYTCGKLVASKVTEAFRESLIIVIRLFFVFHDGLF